MNQSAFKVLARYYGRLADVLKGDRVDFAGIIRSLRLSAGLFAEPDATISFSQVDRLVQKVAQASGRTDLGFELGKLLTASAHSVVGFGMLICSTLDQALRFEARYYRLVLPSFRMRYTGGPDYAEMYLTPLVAMSHTCLAFHLEAIAMAGLREVADLTGNARLPCRLDLSIPEPPHAKRYRALQDVQVRFGAELTPSVRLLFLGNPRSYAVALADPNAHRVAEQRCRRLVQQTTGVRRFADWLAMTLREVNGPLPSVIELAGILNLSKRTLNRHLEREGTSFREVSGRIQHELAGDRLATQGISVSEVAYSLGFSEVSNFARAFRTRCGRSPTEYQNDSTPRVGQRRRTG